MRISGRKRFTARGGSVLSRASRLNVYHPLAAVKQTADSSSAGSLRINHVREEANHGSTSEGLLDEILCCEGARETIPSTGNERQILTMKGIRLRTE